MKRSRFTEEQIAFPLRQADAGNKVPEISRQTGISPVTFYAWRKKSGDLGVADAHAITATSSARCSGI